MIGRAIEQLHPELSKQCSPEFIKELWVAIGDQLSWETFVNQIQSIEEDMSTLLYQPHICTFDKSNLFGELVSY